MNHNPDHGTAALINAHHYVRRGIRPLLLVTAFTILGSIYPSASKVASRRGAEHWIGTWAASPPQALPGSIPTFHNQTLRLIVHVSAAGTKVRIKLSNTFSAQPLIIGGAHIALRGVGVEIDPTSDRTLKFLGSLSTTIPARGMVVSDSVDLDMPALSDLAISLFLPETTTATTSHILALQTSYVSPDKGNFTADVKFPVAKKIDSWPFLTGVDVATAPHGAAIVAFGLSLTDGDGSTMDANRRWPDVLAERLQKEAGGNAGIGVLNEGLIGNRLLSDFDSPRQMGGPFEAVFKETGPALGQAGVTRFERDVLSQAGVRYVILALAVNDILFPGSFIPATESVSAQSLIDCNRQLIARAHKKGIRAIGATIPPFENAVFDDPKIYFFTAEKEKVRQEVNAWIRSSRDFDAVIDFDEAVRDPTHPKRLLPAYDSGDHLHVNDAGNVAQGNAIPLALFEGH